MPKHLQIVSIDWLQLNVRAPKDMIWEYHTFYDVKKLPIITRHFKIVEELYRHGARIATVTRVPLSAIIDKETIIIKFDNWVLYSVNLYTYVLEFLALNQFTFKSFSRIDICQDFQLFNNSMKPSTFIKNYLNGQYLRLGRTSISTAHFRQIDVNLSFNALKFGSNLSEVSIGLYNKTLEMNSVKWKPWIAEKWLKCGLNPDVDTWRLEVSIKDVNKLVSNNDTGEYQELASLEILKHATHSLIYKVFREKYFSFVIKDSQVKKSRMTKLPLFSDSFANYTIVDGSHNIAATRSDKIFIKKLEDVNNDLRGKNIEFNINIDKLKRDYIEVTGLGSWAIWKGLM